jgi:beta-carotene hydroxylase
LAYYKIPGWQVASFLLTTLSVYLCFTIGHEGVHKLIVPGSEKLNYLFSFYAGFVFHIPFTWFEVVHMRHHAFVNHPEKDPDLHCAGNIDFSGILRMMGTFFYYFVYLVRFRLFTPGMIWETLVHYAILGCFYYWGLQTFGLSFLWIFTLPMFVGLVFTVLVFDYIPHHPHSKQGRFENARSYWGYGMEYLSQMHSFHLIHHLWPNIPWYRYRKVYFEKREDLLKAGASEYDFRHNPS